MVAQKIEQLNDEMKRIENEMSKLQKRNEQLNLELARTKEEHQRICGYNIQNLSGETISPSFLMAGLETELTDLIKLHENSLAKVKAEYFERTQVLFKFRRNLIAIRFPTLMSLQTLLEFLMFCLTRFPFHATKELMFSNTETSIFAYFVDAKTAK